jgi:hypothetical protein
MSSLSPEAAKQFSGFDLDGIDALVNASGLSWRDYLREYTNYQSNLNRLYSENLSSDRAVQEAFGGSQAYVDAQAAFKEAVIMRTFGAGKLDATSNTLLSILDENGDGQIDDANTIREKLKTYYGSSVNVSKESIPSLLSKLAINVKDQAGDALYGLVQDGVIDNDELQKVIEDGMMTSKVYDLLEKKTGGLSTAEGGMDILTRQLQTNATKELEALKIPRYADSSAAVAETQKWLDSQPKEMVTRPIPEAPGFKETVDLAGPKNAKKLLDKTVIDIDNVNRLLKQTTSESQREIYRAALKNLTAMRRLLQQTAGSTFSGIAGRRN